MHGIFRVKAYEAEHGPHFNEEHARKAVSKMENEDGTRREKRQQLNVMKRWLNVRLSQISQE